MDLRKVWDTIKYTKIFIMVAPEDGKRKGQKKIFEEKKKNTKSFQISWKPLIFTAKNFN